MKQLICCMLKTTGLNQRSSKVYGQKILLSINHLCCSLSYYLSVTFYRCEDIPQNFCVMQSENHVLCEKSLCLGYLHVKKISLQVLCHTGCNVDLNVFWGSSNHWNSPVRLSFTKSHSNPCPLPSVLLTNGADFFLEWNTEGHCRRKKKK